MANGWRGEDGGEDGHRVAPRREMTRPGLLRRIGRVGSSVLNVVRTATSPYARFAPPGHFYSPLPKHPDDLPDLWIEESSAGVPAIDLREAEQLELLARLSRFYPELPFHVLRRPPLRYYFENDYFSYGDGISLYSILREFGPKRLIEVGSGFSSALMLDTRDLFALETEFTFIEPFPDRLNALLQGEDRRRNEVITGEVQGVPLERFDILGPGDILFIDSSHMLKAGSDVAHLLFRVLPRLASGVLVHFHDVFWPFEYPRDWFEQGRAWNEAYAIRAFLQFNTRFEIILFLSYLAERRPERLEQLTPLSARNPGGSLWLRVT